MNELRPVRLGSRLLNKKKWKIEFCYTLKALGASRTDKVSKLLVTTHASIFYENSILLCMGLEFHRDTIQFDSQEARQCILFHPEIMASTY